MNAELILKTKIDYLSGNSDRDIDNAMAQFVSEHPQLADEIQFIESFWHSDNDPADEQPGAALDARFYRMLSQAQTTQIQPRPIAKAETKTLRPAWWQALFSPRPVVQFATVALVFTLGYSIDKTDSANRAQPIPVQAANSNALTGLQQQVQSLSTLVALSMLNQGSASERLTGIGYSHQSSATDASLDAVLLKLLNTDSSTAVRLATLDAFASRGSVAAIEAQLLASVGRQKQPLVQIGLIKLLADQGSDATLTALSNDRRLSPEGSEYLQQLKKQNMI